MNDNVMNELHELRVHKRLGGRFYRAEDVTELLYDVQYRLDEGNTAQQRVLELEQQKESYDAMQAECERLREENKRAAARLEQQRAEATEQDAARVRELTGLYEELQRLRTETARSSAQRDEELQSLREETERLRRREEFLSADLERKKREIEEYAQMVSSDSVAQAQESAKRILADAEAERDRMLQEYTTQRARVMAATRAAYYNAQRFKMAISRRFSAMERELDETIDVLRVLEVSPMSDTAQLPNRMERAQDEQDSAVHVRGDLDAF